MQKSISKIILLSVCLFYGCSDTDDKLYKYIESHCDFEEADTCYIDIKDALKIDYDKMYLFVELTHADEISKILEIPYNNNRFIPDSKYRIIFLKNDKIVYEDDYYQRHTYFFSLENCIDEKLCCELYTTSIFWIERGANTKENSVFILRPHVTLQITP